MQALLSGPQRTQLREEVAVPGVRETKVVGNEAHQVFDWLVRSADSHGREMNRFFVDIACIEIDVSRNVGAGVNNVALVRRPCHETAAMEYRREHCPVADVRIACERGVVDEHVAFLDVVTEGANDEAQRRAHGADMNRQTIVHRKDLGPWAHERAGEVLGAVKNGIAGGGKNSLGHLAQNAFETGVNDREHHGVHAVGTVVERTRDAGDFLVA